MQKSLYGDLNVNGTRTVSLGRALAQLHGIFILAETEGGMAIVDMHAAHERIIYETLKGALAKKSIELQRLLIPISIQLPQDEVACATHHQAFFQELGFEIDELGEDTLVLRAAPKLLASSPLEMLIRDIIADLKMHGHSDRSSVAINHALSETACRTALRANRKMTVPEMDALLREMEAKPHTNQCNHGRPTCRRFTLQEINQFFMRGR